MHWGKKTGLIFSLGGLFSGLGGLIVFLVLLAVFVKYWWVVLIVVVMIVAAIVAAVYEYKKEKKDKLLKEEAQLNSIKKQLEAVSKELDKNSVRIFREAIERIIFDKGLVTGNKISKHTIELKAKEVASEFAKDLVNDPKYEDVTLDMLTGYEVSCEELTGMGTLEICDEVNGNLVLRSDKEYLVITNNTLMACATKKEVKEI